MEREQSNFDKMGLRVLFFAKRNLSKVESASLLVAITSNGVNESLQKKLENNLTFLGMAALED